MGVENLNKIFNPKSIAVVGASEKKESVGYRLLYNLVNEISPESNDESHSQTGT